MSGFETRRWVILRIEALFLLLWGFTTLSAAASQPLLGEQLEYTLKFRGLITGYVELDIAKVTLNVEEELGQVLSMPAYITNLHLTTAPYSKAELLYPVRLSYKSWLDARELHPLIAFKTLKFRKQREEFFWFDREKGYAHHYQTGEQDEENSPSPPASLQPVAALSNDRWSALNQTKALQMNGSQALDYMGLIHRLRSMPIESGSPIEFSTFNGKEIEWFRIDVSRERLTRAGWDRPSFRLKLREIDPDNGELGESVHIWMSDDDQRLLLRFYAERTFGAMEGILETGRPIDQHQKEGLSEATQSSMETYLDF
ncbi:MAG: DUF3108 domain-containing protein [Candidatus Thiodiazotropha endolucinida]|nr:DUF3108 domain-containing protein [Candidatus Thiodiazotropha taylori]MCW4275507.1 DUF3108 domain-containing protein [Candidatus Thiodiazotropha taylori]